MGLLQARGSVVSTHSIGWNTQKNPSLRLLNWTLYVTPLFTKDPLLAACSLVGVCAASPLIGPSRFNEPEDFSQLDNKKRHNFHMTQRELPRSRDVQTAC